MWLCTCYRLNEVLNILNRTNDFVDLLPDNKRPLSNGDSESGRFHSSNFEIN